MGHLRVEFWCDERGNWRDCVTRRLAGRDVCETAVKRLDRVRPCVADDGPGWPLALWTCDNGALAHNTDRLLLVLRNCVERRQERQPSVRDTSLLRKVALDRFAEGRRQRRAQVKRFRLCDYRVGKLRH